MTTNQIALSGFAQIHVFLYFRIPSSKPAILADLREHAPTLSSTIDPATLLKDPPTTDSHFLGHDRFFSFVCAHRLRDVFALRFVRNEPAGAVSWSQWKPYAAVHKLGVTHPRIGCATLLQCEGKEIGVGETPIRCLVEEALRCSSSFPVSLLGELALPFGFLFELDRDRPTWLLVTRPEDLTAARWMTVDWLRLVTFFMKHNDQWDLFWQGVRGIDEVVAGFEKRDFIPALNADRGDLLLDSVLVELDEVCANLVAAEKGYENALQDSFAGCTNSKPTVGDSFLRRIHATFTGNCCSAKQQLERFRDRLPIVKKSLHIALGVLPTAPVSGECPSPPAEPTFDQRALSLILANPNESAEWYAKELKCARPTLYRHPVIKAALSARLGSRKDLPKGFKDQEGTLDAWCKDDAGDS